VLKVLDSSSITHLKVVPHVAKGVKEGDLRRRVDEKGHPVRQILAGGVVDVLGLEISTHDARKEAPNPALAKPCAFKGNGIIGIRESEKV
jgi:hypothetical protein